MPDLALRALWLAGVAGLAVGTGLVATNLRRSAQPSARITPIGFDGAVIAFTSTDCSNCRKVMRVLRGFDVPVREVTFELEPQLFGEAGVEGVPLVIVLNRAGEPHRQFGGMVRRGRLGRALEQAGW